MIFTNREVAPKQPNFSVSIYIESVECQEGYKINIHDQKYKIVQKNISASFTFMEQQIINKTHIPMQDPLFFNLFKEDYKQKLELEIFEDDLSIGQIQLRLPARPDYIYETNLCFITLLIFISINKNQMEDTMKVDLNDHYIKLKYKFHVINKLIKAQKENNYKKRYNSKNRETSIEKCQQESRKVSENQLYSNNNPQSNSERSKKRSNINNKNHDDSENLPPTKYPIPKIYNNFQDNHKQNQQMFSQKISFDDTINKILQENQLYTNLNYITTYSQDNNIIVNDQSLLQYKQNKYENPLESNRIEEQSGESKSCSFQYIQQDQTQKGISKSIYESQDMNGQNSISTPKQTQTQEEKLLQFNRNESVFNQFNQSKQKDKQTNDFLQTNEGFLKDKQYNNYLNNQNGVNSISNQSQTYESFQSKKHLIQPTVDRKRSQQYDTLNIENKLNNFSLTTSQARFLQSPKSEMKSLRKSTNDVYNISIHPQTNFTQTNIDTNRTSKSQDIQARTKRSYLDISTSRCNRMETQNDSYSIEKQNTNVLLLDTFVQPNDFSICTYSKELQELPDSQTIVYLKNLIVALQLRVQHLKHTEEENKTLREDVLQLKVSRDACLKNQENISQESLKETVKLQQELEGIIKNSRFYLEHLKESRDIITLYQIENSEIIQRIEDLKKQIHLEQNDKRQLELQVDQLKSLIDLQSYKDKKNYQNLQIQQNQLISVDEIVINLNDKIYSYQEMREVLQKVIKEKNESIKENLSIKNDNIKLQQQLMELKLKYEELDQTFKQFQELQQISQTDLGQKDTSDSFKEQISQLNQNNISLLQALENVHQEKTVKQKEFNDISAQYEVQILFLQKNVQNMETQIREVNQTNLELQANNLELSLKIKNIESIQQTKNVLEENLRNETEKNSTLNLQSQSIKTSNEALLHNLVKANEQIKQCQDQIQNYQEQIRQTKQQNETAQQYLCYLTFLINDSYQPDQNDTFDKLLNEQIRKSKHSALIFIILRKIKSGVYQFGSQKISLYTEDNKVKIKGQDDAIKYFERNINTEINKLILSLNPEKEQQFNSLSQIQNKWVESKY